MMLLGTSARPLSPLVEKPMGSLVMLVFDEFETACPLYRRGTNLWYFSLFPARGQVALIAHVRLVGDISSFLQCRQ